MRLKDRKKENVKLTPKNIAISCLGAFALFVVIMIIIGVFIDKVTNGSHATTSTTTTELPVTEVSAEATTVYLVAETTEETTTTTEEVTTLATTTEATTLATTTEERAYVYNDLQKLYCQLDEGMSYSTVLSTIQSYNLPYAEHEYNSGNTIKVAFDEAVTPDKYAESGEYVRVNFSVDNQLEVIEYYNPKGGGVFQYIQGTYYDFRFDTADNDYKGLYISDIKSDDGITITYDNGKSTTTHYVKADTKEEQLIYIDALDYE